MTGDSPEDPYAALKAASTMTAEQLRRSAEDHERAERLAEQIHPGRVHDPSQMNLDKWEDNDWKGVTSKPTPHGDESTTRGRNRETPDA